MTKQHFIAMAEEFNERLCYARELTSYPGSSGSLTQGVIHAIHGFCKVAASFNPQFDRARFLKACGVEGH